MPSFQNTNQSKSERLLPLHLNFTRRKHGQRRKASRAMDKNAGSVFEQRNALARYGRTSGMRCVIAWAERVTDDGFCVFPN